MNYNVNGYAKRYVKMVKKKKENWLCIMVIRDRVYCFLCERRSELEFDY